MTKLNPLEKVNRARRIQPCTCCGYHPGLAICSHGHVDPKCVYPNMYRLIKARAEIKALKAEIKRLRRRNAAPPTIIIQRANPGANQ
jgi:hypothetical protein